MLPYIGEVTAAGRRGDVGATRPSELFDDAQRRRPSRCSATPGCRRSSRPTASDPTGFWARSAQRHGVADGGRDRRSCRPAAPAEQLDGPARPARLARRRGHERRSPAGGARGDRSTRFMRLDPEALAGVDALRGLAAQPPLRAARRRHRASTRTGPRSATRARRRCRSRRRGRAADHADRPARGRAGDARGRRRRRRLGSRRRRDRRRARGGRQAGLRARDGRLLRRVRLQRARALGLPAAST